MIRLAALLGSMASFGNALPVSSSSNATTIAHNFTAVPGYLPAGSPDAAPKQNLTLASAEIICGAIEACIGFTFKSPTATPSGVVQVFFKAVDPYCSYTRFGDGICPAGVCA